MTELIFDVFLEHARRMGRIFVNYTIAVNNETGQIRLVQSDEVHGLGKIVTIWTGTVEDLTNTLGNSSCSPSEPSMRTFTLSQCVIEDYCGSAYDEPVPDETKDSQFEIEYPVIDSWLQQLNQLAA